MLSEDSAPRQHFFKQMFLPMNFRLPTLSLEWLHERLLPASPDRTVPILRNYFCPKDMKFTASSAGRARLTRDGWNPFTQARNPPKSGFFCITAISATPAP